jgi:membrane protease YdiL (CAAX protease family)
MHIIRKTPVLSFIVIAYAWTWSLAYFIKASVYFPLLGLFGPAVAAMFVSHKITGQPIKEVLKGKFTFSPKHILWYLVAVSLPLLLLIPVYFLNSARLDLSGFKLRPLDIIDLIVALLILGEEVGWRGFLLPYFLQRFSPVTSSILVGIIWAFWHLANFLIPEFPHYGLPFTAYVVIVVSYSVLFTWLYLRTEGSLLVAIIFHAALNLFSIDGIVAAREYWLRAVVYSLAAIIVIVTTLRIKHVFQHQTYR